MPWQIAEHEAPGVTRIAVDVSHPMGEWEQWFLLSTDRHHDNPKCRQDLELKHLEQARERNAAILDFGDLFCAMQGKYDKRSSKSDLREEHQNGRYLDALVDTASDFYAPYADLFAVIAPGNHETAILRRHETDLTERLCERLRAHGSTVQRGGYSGWVWVTMTRGTVKRSVKLWYIHGYGGGGPVTRGTIQTFNRQQAYVEGADVTVSGHVHESVYGEIPKIYLDHLGQVQHRTCYVVQSPTYKEEYQQGQGGWHVETGKPPKPLGAWWMRLSWVKAGTTEKPHIELSRAQ